MDALKNLSGKSYLVFGLGRSGLSVCKALSKADIDIIASDDDVEHLSALPKGAIGVAVEDIDWDKAYDALVLSPGIAHILPEPHPVAVKAMEKGIPILSDIDLLCQGSEKAKRVIITGTNGKSTTTALIGHILSAHFDRVDVGGNIGTPVFDFRKNADVQVIEASSYQLERCPNLSCDVAVWLNITPDHLDRHGDMQGYVDAKYNIFNGSRGIAQAVIGMDDEYSAKVMERVKAGEDWVTVPISGKTLPEGGYGVDRAYLCFEHEGETQSCLDLRGLNRLRGEHNAQNIAASWAACAALGVPNTVIADAVKSFQGLAHRQYLVRTINGVAYINDSKATNAEASYWALKTYDSAHLILGGVSKAGGLSGLEPLVSHIRKAFLIGQAGHEFAVWLDNHGVSYEMCETLDNAVLKAHEAAQQDRGLPGKNPVVLFSPACASFDQFPNFEVRGEAFEKYVHALDDAA